MKKEVTLKDIKYVLNNILIVVFIFGAMTVLFLNDISLMLRGRL